MGILEMLRIANEKDTGGEIIASQQCIQLLDHWDLCPFGVRLYSLYIAGQRTGTGGKVPPCWLDNDTPQSTQENTVLEHARYRVQMFVRDTYMQHIVSCKVNVKYDILPMLQSVADILSQECVCENAKIPGPSLTFWYSRKGDPLTMQQLYLAAKSSR